MAEELSKENLDVIETALNFARQKVADSSDHPDPKFKQQQLKRVDDALGKIREIKKRHHKAE
jgi:hypothetical protein